MTSASSPCLAHEYAKNTAGKDVCVKCGKTWLELHKGFSTNRTTFSTPPGSK